MTLDDQPLTTNLEDAIARGLAARDRADMAPTIDYFERLLASHPGNAAVLLEVAGAYDTAGEEAIAAQFYQQAFDAGLSGDRRRRALLQYGSTLRNLGRHDESLEVLSDARNEFPQSDSLRMFHALSLHAAGRPSAALAALMELVADRIDSDDLTRYDAAIRGNAAYLAGLD